MKKNIILFFVVAFFSQMVFAEVSQYQINVLVVEKITAAGLNSEVWLPIKNLPEVESAINPDTLNTENCQLNAEAEQLTKMGYRVLVNNCWKQPIPIEKDATPMHITGGDSISNKVDGTITIGRNSKYLSLQTNILLSELDSYLKRIGDARYDAKVADFNPKRFQLKQDFNMHTNELAYVDHPLFGLVIKIIPTDNVPI